MVQNRKSFEGGSSLLTLFLCMVFFLSGTAALIFETLWFRLSGLMFGNSVWAVSMVLSAFMGGLAVGNGIVAVLGHRLRYPVRWYALAEVVVAVAGLSLVLIFPGLAGWLAPMFGAFVSDHFVLNILRLAIAFALMLVPTTAMGITLAVLVKALYGEYPNFGWALGRLYGWNTVGAVVGAIAGEVFLIRWFGIRGAGYAAASLSCLAAGLAIWLSGKMKVKETLPALPTAKDIYGLSRKGARVLLASFVSGGILLGLEVVWFRFLQLYVKGTSMAFAVMLAVVLAGIGFGGLAASRLLKNWPGAHRLVTGSAFAAGTVSVAVYLLFDPSVAGESGFYAVHTKWSAVALLSVCLTFPVSMLSGFLFVMLGGAVYEKIGSETGATGMLTLSNTAGAMVGALLAGFALLPCLGMEKSYFILSAAYGAVALCAADRSLLGGGKARYANYSAALIFFLSLAFFPFGMMDERINSPGEKYNRLIGSRTVAVREGRTETIHLLRRDMLGEPLYYHLLTNGYSTSSTHSMSRRYMKLFVLWPAAVHPDLRSALLISYGLGNTAKALTDMRGLRRIDVVDISRDVLDVTRKIYANPDDDPLNDKRVNVYIEDGRQFLLTVDRKYDLVTAEPPPPKVAGIVNLYSQEYFQMIYDHLREGGISTYWLPARDFKEAELKSVLKAFCNVFEDCSLWTGAGLDWMMVGTRNLTGPVAESDFVHQWKDPVVGRVLRDIGIERPEQLGALFIADAAFLREFVKDSHPLVDNFPKRLFADTTVPEDFYFSIKLMDPTRTKERFGSSEYIQKLWPPAIRTGTMEYFEFQDIINKLIMPFATQGPLAENLYKALTESSLHTLPLWLLESGADEQRIIEKVVGKRGRRARDKTISYHLGARALADRDFPAAERYFSVARDDLRIFSLCMAGRAAEAEILAEEFASRGGARRNFYGQYRSFLENNCGLSVR